MKSKNVRAVGVILGVLAFLVAYIFVYAFFHETGHAIVVLLYGGRIDHFVVLDSYPHVNYHGGNFSTFGAALLHAAGMLLPVILGAIAIGFYRTRIQSIYYHKLYMLISISLAASMLPWAFLPVLSLFAPLSPGEDVTKFLNVTGFHPLLVSLAAILLINASVLFIYKKGMFGIIKQAFMPLFRKKKINFKHTLVLGAVYSAVIIGIMLYAFNGVFTTSFHVQDARIAKNIESPFVIKRAGNYVMDLAAPARGLITVVRITGTDGKLAFQSSGEDFSLTRQEIKFEKGNYTLSVIYLTDRNALEQFFKNTGQKENLSLADRQSYEKAFNHTGHDYSADFSIKIR